MSPVRDSFDGVATLARDSSASTAKILDITASDNLLVLLVITCLLASSRSYQGAPVVEEDGSESLTLVKQEGGSEGESTRCSRVVIWRAITMFVKAKLYSTHRAGTCL